jgi:transcriptional regulator with GAF, ATPase, and Fis domain
MVDRNLGTVSAPSPRLQRVQASAAVGDKDLEALLKLLAKKVHAPENADGRALTDALGRIARSALSTYRSQHQTIPTAQLEVLAEKAVNRFLALYPQAKSVVHVRRGKPGRPKALTLEQVKAAKRLLAKGYSVRQAAAALGVKRSTLHSAVRKLSTLPAYPEPVSGQVAKACAATSKNY